MSKLLFWFRVIYDAILVAKISFRDTALDSMYLFVSDPNGQKQLGEAYRQCNLLSKVSFKINKEQRNNWLSLAQTEDAAGIVLDAMIQT